MNLKNKKLRRNQRRGHGNDFDGLSCLPDNILIHILSFLDTKSAVRTSILSKRYKDLWASLQSFAFKLLEDYTETDSARFYDGYVISRAGISSFGNSSVDTFESTVNNVLKCREHSNLISFGLSLHKAVNKEFFLNCLNYVAKHNVEHLKIRGYVKPTPIKLPTSLLTASKLTTLHMSNAVGYCIDLPNSVDWPSLKVLCLKNFVFVDFNAELFSGCPNLETLILNKCCIKPGNNLRNLDVHCPNLRKLEILNWRSPWRFFHEQTISVYSPKLVFFKLEGSLARVTFRDGLPYLDEACIDFSCPTACSSIDLADRKPRTAEVFLGMLHTLCNVKVLSLSFRAIEVLSSLPDLHLRVPYRFGSLKFIRFSAENKCKERTVPIKTFVRLLEKASTCVLVVKGKKEPKLSRDCARVKHMHKDASRIALPGNVMQFLLASTPAVEFLTIEAPQAPSDKE